MTGLAGNANLRLVPPAAGTSPDPADVVVEIEPGTDAPVIDDKNNILRIEHPDGSITVSLDGKPIESARDAEKPGGWFKNLAEGIDKDELSRITDDLLRGVADDLQSRQEWIDDRAQGIRLLGLKIELPNVQGATDGAPVEGMSRVRHPLLLEAVLRFQANARGELLPTDGPVKVRNDSTSPTPLDTSISDALEMDLNHYLTAVATEYYPDTDRMLFQVGFAGGAFKKVYQCPLRMRPVSESVDAEDLIVNQSATDLASAQRVTHRVMMKPSTVRRMQLLGVYRDIALPTPLPPENNSLDEEKRAQQGIAVNLMGRPEDREREIYEIYCELDIKGFEHKMDGKETGLEIPYVVTIDKSSRECLAVVRNHGETDQPLPVARKRFVLYPFVPGLGFYPIGLLHILGNTTNAVTAAWRLMLDNGMFANFPGFLMADGGGRQNTNIFRVPPGGGAQIKTNGQPIRDAAMPLPYTTGGMPATMQLVDNMVETGRRLGGTAEVQVGEGRADVPVGTVLALIEQAVKVLDAVHKRIHAAQAEEFQLLKELFREHPETFFQRKCKSKSKWDRESFLAALNNCDMVPQADPNTASSGERIMKVMGLMQLSAQAPQLYDPIKTHTAALGAMGWPDPELFFIPPQARTQPPIQLQQLKGQMANEEKAAAAKITEANARATEAGAKLAEVKAKDAAGAFMPKHDGAKGPEQPPPETQVDLATAHAKLMDAETRRQEVGLKAASQVTQAHNERLERESRQQDDAIDLAKAVITDPQDAASAGKKATGIIHEIDKGLGK
jgi:hypothetical protein